MKMKQKILNNMVYIAVVAVLITTTLIGMFTYYRYMEQIKTGMKDEAAYLAASLNFEDQQNLDKYKNITNIFDKDCKWSFQDIGYHTYDSGFFGKSYYVSCSNCSKISLNNARREKVLVLIIFKDVAIEVNSSGNSSLLTFNPMPITM